MVLGFAAALIGAIANAFANYKVSYLYSPSGALAAADVKFYGWTFLLARMASTGGMWVGAVGLLWHVLSGDASPNNRSSGP